MNRLEYLAELSTLTDKPLKELFKKEIDDYLLTIFGHVERIGMGSFDELCFGFNLGLGRDYKRVRYFTYKIKFCHLYFHPLEESSNDIWHVLKNEIKLSDTEFENAIRFQLKQFFKTHEIIPHKKVKYFRHRYN